MKYRKKPVVIEAVQFVDGGYIPKCLKFCPTAVAQYKSKTFECRLVIPTLEGDMICNQGDWIIKGVKGEFYPCKSDIFDISYEPVGEP